MKLSELLTYVIAWVRVVEVGDDDEVVELYLGRHGDVPKYLLNREISHMSGSVKGYIWICLTPDGK